MTSWRMPAETEPHARTWMAWPSAGYTLGESAADAHEARSTWAAVALAVARWEPVEMLVRPEDEALARRFVGSDVTLHPCALDDAWMRDIGPTFVVGDGPTGPAVAAVDWVFNGWGAQEWAAWEHDEAVGRAVAALAGTPVRASPLVQEGGAVHTDGAGTVLVTETVQLDPGRNPGWTRADVDAELARTLGAHSVVWLPRGLTRDSETYGTRGHVDLLATFAAPDVVLVHRQADPAHPDHAVSLEVERTLRDWADRAGRALDVVPLVAPTVLRDDVGWVDHSYVNHYVVNGAVIACTFGDTPGDRADDAALGVLREAYPGRAVVGIDARPLFARGGGIHCITQQEPAVGNQTVPAPTSEEQP